MGSPKHLDERVPTDDDVDPLRSLEDAPDSAHYDPCVGPFRGGSKYDHVPVIMGAYFTLLETIRIRAQLQKNTIKTTKKLMKIALDDGWSQQEGWKTVYVALPRVEETCTSMQSKWMDVTHTLVLKMHLRLSATNGYSGIEYETQKFVT
ncbi:hypothetical protein BG011_005802 [Mortierella polycephala]|uniref:Uncharacterized protein n=1 Tax=Mortierella polycephala TaxID=41804 RepID=A0A9P6PWA7_9FUNG|nr:hypothetical protein BG011_005802 [Mortierella polycephala]